MGAPAVERVHSRQRLWDAVFNSHTDRPTREGLLRRVDLGCLRFGVWPGEFSVRDIEPQSMSEARLRELFDCRFVRCARWLSWQGAGMSRIKLAAAVFVALVTAQPFGPANAGASAPAPPAQTHALARD